MTILTNNIYWIRRLGSVSACTEPLKISQTSSSHVRLALSCWYLFHQLAFHQSVWVQPSRFPEACVSERPTFLISWFSMMPSCGLFPIVWEQYRTLELLEDHHDIWFVDFDLLPEFMQIMLSANNFRFPLVDLGFLRRTPRRPPVHPSSLSTEVWTLLTGPSASRNTFSVSTITDGYDRTINPYVGLTVHRAVSVRRSSTGRWPSW